MPFSQWVKQNLVDKNRLCLITGGSSGIGLEYAKHFAKLGCNLIIVSENETELDTVKHELEHSFSISVICIVHDFRNPSTLELFLATLSGHEIGALVNNAGFGLKGNLQNFSNKTYRGIISCHTIYPTAILKHVLEQKLIDHHLLLINVVTINVISPTPNTAVYTATKSFALSLFLSVEAEYSVSDVIWHNCLPGTTRTPFHKKQGVVPMAMTMTPEVVVERSLKNFRKRIYAPNRIDRFGILIFKIIPTGIAMRLAKHIMKLRLGV